jgi:hypothetical protein
MNSKNKKGRKFWLWILELSSGHLAKAQSTAKLPHVRQENRSQFIFHTVVPACLLMTTEWYKYHHHFALLSLLYFQQNTNNTTQHED